MRRPPSGVGRRGAVALGLAAAALFSCARPQAPPGGEEDRTPPRVASVSPEPRSVVDAWDGPVVFRFDERISEQRVEEAVLVSPETGRLELDRTSWGSNLEVSLEGGWQPGRIYHVVVRPVIQDLFGNSREEPIELVFSTGPEIPSSALLGDVSDRLTAEAVDQARVEAVADGDSIPYVAVTDAEGLFVHRSLPPGRYRLSAYADRNQSRQPDAFEPQDSGRVSIGGTDTMFVSMQLLLPDSTPARLAQATPQDSVSVRLSFDDAFDPEEPLDSAELQLRRLPDSTDVEARLMHAHAYDALLRERRDSAADSAAAAEAADTTRADTTAAEAADTTAARPGTAGPGAVPPDTARPAAGPIPEAAAAEGAAAEEAGEGAAQTREAPLPARELVVVPGSPLEPEAEYRVTVDGLTNIAGVPGGGGSDTFQAPVPPPPDTAQTVEPQDSAAVPDTTQGAEAPDTLGADEAPDTAVGEPLPALDTVRDTVPPDTTAAPDTTAIRPRGAVRP